MIDLFAVLRSLTLPGGSAPDAPQINIGPDTIPDELVAYYASAPDNHTVLTGILYRQNLTNYDYDVLIVNKVTGQASRAEGVCVAGTVYELSRLTPIGTSATRTYGTRGNPNVEILGGSGLTLDDSQLTVLDGGQIYIDPDPAGEGPGTLWIDGQFYIDSLHAARGHRDANFSNAGIVCTTVAGAEIAVPSAKWNSEPTYTFKAGRLYRIHSSGTYPTSAAGDNQGFIRIRKGAATVAGTQLLFYSVVTPTAFAGIPISFSFHGYIQNATGSDVSTKLSMTIARAAGPAEYRLYGDGNVPLIIEVEDIGVASDQPGIQALAVSV